LYNTNSWQRNRFVDAGAYILAGELFCAKTYQDAFASYDRKMRAYAQSCQKLPPGVLKLVYPQSKIGVKILNSMVPLIASRPAKWIMGLLGSEKKAVKKEIYPADYGNEFTVKVY